MNVKTTTQAAAELGISRKTLLMWVYNHPKHSPAIRLHPSGDFIWNDQEIEVIREARKHKSKAGRPPKKTNAA